MKKYSFTPKFRKLYKDTNNVTYFISSELKIYMRTYENGRVDSEGETHDWDNETRLMTAEEVKKGKYITSEDVLPFKIGQYCMSEEHGAVQIASVEERQDHNYYLIHGGKSISHYGNEEYLRPLTPTEMSRYVL